MTKEMDGIKASLKAEQAKTLTLVTQLESLKASQQAFSAHGGQGDGAAQKAEIAP